MLTEDELEAIEERASAATPGPWCVYGSDYDEDSNEIPMPYALEQFGGDVLWSSGSGEYTHPDMPTAQFIAHSREDVPKLVAEVRALHAAERERDQLHEGLRNVLEALGNEVVNTHVFDPGIIHDTGAPIELLCRLHEEVALVVSNLRADLDLIGVEYATAAAETLTQDAKDLQTAALRLTIRNLREELARLKGSQS